AGDVRRYEVEPPAPVSEAREPSVEWGRSPGTDRAHHELRAERLAGPLRRPRRCGDGTEPLQRGHCTDGKVDVERGRPRAGLVPPEPAGRDGGHRPHVRRPEAQGTGEPVGE